MWNKIMGTVKANIPPYEDFTLSVYRKQEVNKSTEYIEMVCREATRLFNGEIESMGSITHGPEERLKYVLNHPLLKGTVDIQKSELRLTEHIFKYDGELYSIFLYLPYYYNDSIVISGTNYHVHFAIIEKVIHRSRDGIVIKVMRTPLHFWRNEIHRGDPLVTVNAYHKSNKRRTKKYMTDTVGLYLLTTYGFAQMLKLLNISSDDLSFVDAGKDDVLTNTAEHEYINCTQLIRGRYVVDLELDLEEDINIDTGEVSYMKPQDRRDVYIKVSTELLNDITKRRFMSTILYILSFFTGYTTRNLYDTKGYVWKIILGRSISKLNATNLQAAANADKHLKSFATSLDPYTQTQLSKVGVNCKHIYDLFLHVFLNIDKWLVYHSPSDLFERKLSVIDLLLGKIVQLIFTAFYRVSNSKTKQMGNNMRAVTKLRSDSIHNLHLLSGLVRSNPTIYNSNWLISIGGNKIRQPANQNKKSSNANILTAREHLFDPSMAAVESIMMIPTSSPGVGGSINPYIKIDEDGNFIREDYVKELDTIKQYFTNF